MAFHCVVVGCSNGSYRLTKWKSLRCEKHASFHEDEQCNCQPPFKLFPFPTVKKDNEMREKWIKMVNRMKNNSRQEFYDPGKNGRICSIHFEDGHPTPKNPLPTLCMGYENAEKRALLFTPTNSTRRKRKSESPMLSSSTSSSSLQTSSSESSVPSKKSLSLPLPLSSNIEGRNIIRIQYPVSSFTSSDKPSPAQSETEMVTPLIQTSQEPSITTPRTTTPRPKIIKNINKAMKFKVLKFAMKEKKSNVIESKKEKKPLYQELLKNDQKCLFYTNIPKLELFNKLHEIMKGFVRNRFHRKASVSVNLKNKHVTPKKRGRQRVLNSKDELLLTMMKIRLGLLFEDLGDRFGISKSGASKIFQCWIRALSKSLASLIFLPEEENIRESTPVRFRKFNRLNGIIDCTELFIETPKNLELQRATWSEYKHHNTLKLLISVLPNSSISFISEPYTGSISDKAIVNKTNFLDTLPPYCSLMTDKGFSNIATECAEHSVHLIVPPGRRGTSQMTPEEVVKTSDIAKTRILVEQVIRRVKTFRILAGEIPISLLRHLHDIMIVCCAISNFRQSIMK